MKLLCFVLGVVFSVLAIKSQGASEFQLQTKLEEDQRTIFEIVSNFKNSYEAYDLTQDSELSKSDSLKTNQFQRRLQSEIRITVKAFDALKDFKYMDITPLVVEMLKYEMNTRANPRVIREALLTLKELADHRHVNPLDKLSSPESLLLDLKQELIDLMQSDSKKFGAVARDIKKDVTSVIEEAKRRRTPPLKSLFSSTESLSLNSLEQYRSVVNQREAARKLQDEEAARIAALGPHTTDTASQEAAKNYAKFKEYLAKQSSSMRNGGMNEVKAGDSSAVDLVLAGTTRFITDDIADDIINDKLFKIIGRDQVLEDVLLVLSRYKQQNAVLIGSKGSGKTAVMDLVAEQIVKGSVAHNPVTEFLKDAIVIQTSSARISRLAKTDKPAGQADAMEAYFQAVSDIQAKIQRRVIVVVDEIHTLTPPQVEAIKPFIESSRSQILLVGASTSTEFRNAFKYNEAFLRRIEQVPVRDLTEAEIIEVFKNSWINILKSRHNDIIFSDDVIKLLIRKAQVVYPDKGITDGTFILADHIAGYLRFKNNGSANLVVTIESVYEFIKKQIGLPVDPRNHVEMERYRRDLKNSIMEGVFGQERMVNDVVDLWMDVLRNESKRGIRVGMLLGRSGTGKTETADQLAIKALGSVDRVFTIKGSDYRDANDIKLSELFGVPGGVEFARTSAGRLMDWLDDPSKGKHAGVVVIDEIDKANELFFLKMMELLETGRITGGDGKTRILNKHIVLLTSNHGDKIIFPDTEVWTEESMKARLKEFSLEDLRSLYEKLLPDSIVNRVDMLTVSNIITVNVANSIANKIVESAAKEYLERSDVILEVKKDVFEEFIKINEPTQRGARNLVRSLDREIRGAVERALGSIPYSQGDKVVLSIGTHNGEKVLVAEINGKTINKEIPRSREGANNVFSLITSADDKMKSAGASCVGLFR